MDLSRLQTIRPCSFLASLSPMDKLLAVGCGGFLGAIMRYGIIVWIPRVPAFQDCPIPIATLAVNLIGCFMIGSLKGLADCLHVFNPSTTLFLFTGLLGSFTTFSTFGFETWRLLDEGKIFEVILYVSLSVFLGILLVWLGYSLCCRVFQNP